MSRRIATINRQNLISACKILAGKDSDLAIIYENYGTPPLWKRDESFQTLLHIILEQQVSVASALAAFNKLKESVGEITPEAVLKLSDEQLKASYFSRQKIVYVRELAKAVSSGELDLKNLQKLADKDVKTELTKIKGIGIWSADIYLLMAMSRPDIMPKGDLALHIAWQKLTKSEIRPNSDEFQMIAEKWKPLRSVAARLLWHYYLQTKALQAR